jgi:hypothetical protein
MNMNIFEVRAAYGRMSASVYLVVIVKIIAAKKIHFGCYLDISESYPAVSP